MLSSFNPRSLLASLFCAFLVFSFNSLSSESASVLASWLLSSDGVLKLRTTPRSKLDAYYQAGFGGIGDRIWIDFPGELSKPRKIVGNGPVKEIRLGKPYQGSTRLVVEFHTDVFLNPSELKLLGTSPSLWHLDLVGLNTNGLRDIGEGQLIKNFSSVSSSSKNTLITNLNYQNNYSPSISLPRGKFKVVIDPGHGGPDSGAVGLNGLKETDVVLGISKDVASFLSQKGVIVKLTRRKNIDLDLTERVLIANRSNADVFVSIHANASRGYRRDVSGIETYFFTGSRGRSLASKIQNELVALPGGSPDRGVRQSRFFVIRKTNMPAALVEVGFVTGRLDAMLLSQQNHKKEIALAISNGILKYLKETY